MKVSTAIGASATARWPAVCGGQLRAAVVRRTGLPDRGSRAWTAP
ncbi:hypothetical protein ACIHIX_18330 [Streptomyces sp. NPDC051913]